jgi:signal transduction histidine kinase
VPSSPTVRLLCGFLLTLAAVGVYSWYTLQQVDGLRELQTQTIDRNRRSSLQLLRIQNNLNALAMAMRDMQSGEEPYPIAAYEAQFRRIRTDLEDAMRLERDMAPVSRAPAHQQMLSSLFTSYWDASARVFKLGQAGMENEARRMIDVELQPAHAAVTGMVARLLVSNNEAEERATAEIQRIYDGVEHNIYRFLIAVLLTIMATSLALIYYNRRIFERLRALTEQKGTLARKLIEVQESVLHSVARELHDEFGQILTAIGTMLTRAERRILPEDSTVREQLLEVQAAAQSALGRVRTLSQALHPAVLDDYGLEKTVEWHLRNFERQTGIEVDYRQDGELPVIKGDAAIHVYRILQEALNNVARHSQASKVRVCVVSDGGDLRLEVEDHGVGLPAADHQNGLGLIAMRERAELLGGRLALLRPPAGGTLVSLEVPIGEEDSRSSARLAKASQ